MLPAKEVGGDLYDYFMVDDKRLFFSLGDVSGKGVPASLFMFATQHMLRSLAPHSSSLPELIASLNNNLAAENSSAMFVTMVVGLYDIDSGELEFVLAGHQAPLVCQANGTIIELKGESNLPVGNVEGIEFVSQKVQLNEGDRLVAFTDGITEACDSRGALLGMEAFSSQLKATQNSSCEDVIESIFSSVGEYSDNAEMGDDMTVLCLKRHVSTSES